MGRRDRSDLAACSGTTAKILRGSKLIPCTTCGLCELSCALFAGSKTGGGPELGVPSAQRGPGKLPGQACCKARAVVRDRNRNRVS